MTIADIELNVIILPTYLEVNNKESPNKEFTNKEATNKEATNMKGRNLWVDLLAATFGIGAWVAINGLWVELPLLVQELPEGWSLPSYLSIITQVANIGPISYSVLRQFQPSMGPKPIIYIILCIGCLSSFFLCIFWDYTTYIGLEVHSTALMALVFFLALVDCTSSVLYIPYMAVWKDIYLPSYLIGEGLSGLLPALAALGQGVGGETTCQNVTFNNSDGTESIQSYPNPLEPNFSVDVFFYIIFAMMVASASAFVLLEFLPSIRKEHCPFSDSVTALSQESPSHKSSLVTKDRATLPMSVKTFAFLLVVQAWSSSLSNGFMPSIQSYSCGVYGNEAYHLAATLSAISNPLAAFCTMILPRTKPKMVGFLAAVGSLLGSYAIITAILTPSPPLMDKNIGSVLIVLSWVAFTGVITYVRVEIANLMREEGAPALFWSGVVTQAGSASGAIVAFVLVNKTNIFVSYNPCA